MKFLGLVIASAIASTSAFAPAPRSFVVNKRDASLLAEKKVPFFAANAGEDATPAAAAAAPAVPEKSLEDEIEELTKEEVTKIGRAHV